VAREKGLTTRASANLPRHNLPGFWRINHARSTNSCMHDHMKWPVDERASPKFMVRAARNSQNISRDTSTKDEVQIDHHEHATIVGVRIVVEWVFKEITQQFAYLSWKREHKVFLKACLFTSSADPAIF
jgi:hypothetical protein